MILVKNIVKLFVTETAICAKSGLQLSKYQIEKHGWSNKQWSEYFQMYLDNLNDVGLCK